jgi:hypothetical protein
MTARPHAEVDNRYMSYREVLRPPVWTYALVAGLLALLCFTFAAVVGVPAAVAVWAALVAIGVVIVHRRTMSLEADAEGLRVGDHRLDAEQITAVTPLDEEAMRRLAGPESDPRARLVLRNLATRTGIRVDLESPSVPYWLVSSGHPEELARALQP